MNYYIDVEATQPNNEIISIGVVNDAGKCFYSLVRPTLSELSPQVTKLTHITEDMLAAAPTLDDVMAQLYNWLCGQNVNYINDHFYSYGEDILFFKASLSAIKTEYAFTIMASIMAKLEDASKKVFECFHGSVSLINAFNYIKSLESEQQHNALEDAYMLKIVYNYAITNPPLAECPAFVGYGHRGSEITGEMPHGKFFASTSPKFKKEIEFENIDVAIDWLIETHVCPIDRPNVHRKRMALKIMKALRSKSQYCELYWRREKEKNI